MTEKLPRNVKRHGKGYRAVVQVDGRRSYGPTVDTPEKAAEWARSFKHADVPGTVLTLSDGLDLLNVDLRQEGAAEATFGFYADHLAAVFDHFGETTPLHRIDERAVRGFIDAQQAAGLSNGTIRKRVNAIGRILKLAVRQGYLPSNPIATLRRPKHRQKRYRAFAAEQVLDIVDRMLAWQTTARSGPLSQRRDADMVLLFFFTGIRRTEASRLTVDDIDIPRGELAIDGKNDGRRLPIARDLGDVMARLIAGADPKTGKLFPGPSAISWIFGNWRRRLAPLPGFSAHALRHSFASAAAANGASPFELKELLGHKRIEQVLTYFHSQGEAARGVVDGLNPRRRRAAGSPPEASPDPDRPDGSPASG